MNKKLFKKVNNQAGSVTIEALISFTGFLFVIFTILGTINVCRTQMLVSSAVDTAAKELSQYAYFYKMSGLQKFDKSISKEAEVGKKNVNEVIGTVDNLYSTLAGAVDQTVEDTTNLVNATKKGELDLQSFETAIKNVDEQGNEIVGSIHEMTTAFEKVGDDPLLYMRSLVAIAGGEASEYVKKAIAIPLAKFFVQKHFGSNRREANEALEKLGIEGGLDAMNFNMSTLFSDADKEDIEIIVYYKVKLVSLLGFEPLEVTLCKKAVCKAWLGGDDVQVYVKATEQTTENENSEGESNSEGQTTEGSNNQTEETEPEQMPEEIKESTQTSETEPTDEVVDTTGSYWHLGLDKHYYDEKAAAFDDLLISSKGITREEVVVNGLIYGRDDHNTAYGMDYCTTAEEAEGVAAWAYYDSIKALKSMEKAYDESGGNRGYEPGSTTRYVYVVYVPENISDEEYNKIKATIQKDELWYVDIAYEDFGMEISASVEIIKAGGNYDYGAKE